MLFNSLQFLYFFFPVTYFVFLKLTSKKQRYVWLTVSGYVFYSFWNYKFCLLMALSTTVSYFAGLGFLRWKTQRARRLCLVMPVKVKPGMSRCAVTRSPVFSSSVCANPSVSAFTAALLTL